MTKKVPFSAVSSSIPIWAVVAIKTQTDRLLLFHPTRMRYGRFPRNLPPDVRYGEKDGDKEEDENGDEEGKEEREKRREKREEMEENHRFLTTNREVLDSTVQQGDVSRQAPPVPIKKTKGRSAGLKGRSGRLRNQST